MPDAQCTRSLVCAGVVKKCTRVFTAVAPESPGIPARNGFNGFLRDLPGDRLFCHRRRQRLSCRLDASVEASGPHDFSVRDRLRQSLRRAWYPPAEVLAKAEFALSSKAPLASTASRPASVTMASAPRVGRDGGTRKVICGFGKPEYFFARDWTGRNSLIRLEKLDFRRKSTGAHGTARSPEKATAWRRRDAARQFSASN